MTRSSSPLLPSFLASSVLAGVSYSLLSSQLLFANVPALIDWTNITHSLTMAGIKQQLIDVNSLHLESAASWSTSLLPLWTLFHLRIMLNFGYIVGYYSLVSVLVAAATRQALTKNNYLLNPLAYIPLLAMFAHLVENSLQFALARRFPNEPRPNFIQYSEWMVQAHDIVVVSANIVYWMAIVSAPIFLQGW